MTAACKPESSWVLGMRRSAVRWGSGTVRIGSRKTPVFRRARRTAEGAPPGGWAVATAREIRSKPLKRLKIGSEMAGGSPSRSSLGGHLPPDRCGGPQIGRKPLKTLKTGAEIAGWRVDPPFVARVRWSAARAGSRAVPERCPAVAAARKIRRKPLKTLKTGSEMAGGSPCRGFTGRPPAARP